MAIFIEREEYDFLLRSARFCEKIELYADILGLDHGEILAYKNDNAQFNYVFANQTQYGSLAESYMRYKISNMQARFADLLYQCRNSSNYTTSIGEELGLNHSSNSQKDFAPDVKMEYLSTGQPVLKWDKGNFDGVEIWKDSGNKAGYQQLAKSYTHRFIDTSPLPLKGICKLWKYCVIYLLKDEMVGSWSEEIEVVARGPLA